MNLDLNIKAKDIKLLEESIVKKSINLGYERDCLNTAQKAHKREKL